MATAGANKQYQAWNINDKLRVSVHKIDPLNTDAKLIFEFFCTDRPYVEMKMQNISGKQCLQIPVLHSPNNLNETFRKHFKKFVTKDNDIVMIPIDNAKKWTKKRFCEVILEECTALTLNYPVKLGFCTLEDHNFDEAVKVCDAKMKGVTSKQGMQKGKKSNGPSISVVKDSLEKVKVDAIACTTATDFSLSTGSVSNALLKRGGYDLQIDLFHKSGRKDNGEVIPVPGHKLDCRMVFFGVLYPFNPRENTSQNDFYRKSIHNFMQRCLNLADMKGLQSIAFHAIGAGILKYPVDIVADQMFKTVDEWQGNNVKDVKFVIFPKDHDVFKEFERAEKKYGLSKNPSSLARDTRNTHTTTFSMKSTDSQVSAMEYVFAIPKNYTVEFVKICCSDTIDYLEKSDCDVSFKNHSMIVKFPPEIYDIGKTRVIDAFTDMQKMYPAYELLDLKTNLKLSDVKKKISEIEKSTGIRCSINNSETQLSLYGKMTQAVKDAKDKVFSLLRPPKSSTEQNHQKEVNNSKDTGTKPKSLGVSRQFSWSISTQAVRVFQTKEKVTVKVYSSDILCVPVDCIVNAANTNLQHGGGLARAIANAAGKDLTKEGCDYLKRHGKLKVGEVCSTGAGKLNYKFVIHAVGPCWSDYQPHSLGVIERCETDLYNAVINSLKKAEILNMETIAVSSISSGIFGCPLDLCSVQYAKAVVDYSRMSNNPLKEIHFVDTNMEMVKVLHETFQSMISGGHMPKSYNKMKYCKEYNQRKDGKSSPRSHDKISDKKAFEHHKANKKEWAKVLYPYHHRDIPPGHSTKEFACCFGPGQNLYIYSADILSMTGKDMIACGNIPNGKTKGYLANAIRKKGGDAYKAEEAKAFAKKSKEGQVVVCSGGDLKNYKWVAHVILHKIQYSKEEKEKQKVMSSLQNIFDEMKAKSCHSIALPLVGTGKGNANPIFYGQRFFEALDKFASSNKSYRFQVHLVHKSNDQTKMAVSTIAEACKNVDPQQKRTIQNETKHISFGQNSVASHKSGDPKPNYNCGQNRYGKNHRYSNSMRTSEKVGPLKSTKQPDSWSMKKEMYERDIFDKTKFHKGTITDEGNILKANMSEMQRKNEYAESEEKDRRKKDSEFHEIKRRSSSDTSPDRSGGSDGNGCNNPTKETKGNLMIFEDTPQKNIDPKVAEQDNDDSSDETNMRMSKKEVKNTNDEEGDDDDFNDDDEGDDDCDESDDEDEEVYDVEPSSDDGPDKAEEDDEGEVETCVICMDEITDPRTLSCGHVFCTECIEAQFTYKEVCPTCGNVCGIITGDQPYGKMDVIKNDRASCAGFESCGRIEITYKFPDGTQGPSHPRPNARYKGITRTAYLPNNRRGNEVCEMLKVAFERKLVFTIGNSRTTGAEGVITWNDIHHKTDQKPNTQFGFPDPSYLDRVTDELKIKGITVDDIPTMSTPHRQNRK